MYRNISATDLVRSSTSQFIHVDLQRLERGADQRTGQASHLCASIWGNHCYLIRASPRGMLLLQIYYRQGGCQTGLWHGRTARTLARRAWKGSHVGSHQGLAKWWWVVSAVRNNHQLGIQRQSVSCNIDSSLSKRKAKQSLLLTVRDLQILHVCFLR